MNHRGSWGRGNHRGRGNQNFRGNNQQCSQIPMICDTRFFHKGSGGSALNGPQTCQNYKGNFNGGRSDEPQPPSDCGGNVSSATPNCFKSAPAVDLDSVPFLETRGTIKQQFEQDNPYFCKSCFKGYPLRDAYIRHLQNHVQCNFPDCQFVGTPNVVEKHHNNLHLFKMNKSSTSGMEQYRNERKRNYPGATVTEPLGIKAVNSAQSTSCGDAKQADSDDLTTSEATNQVAVGTELDKVERLLKEAESSQLPKRDLFPKRRKPANNLLENLLHDEIEHERNVLLQCVRYVVDNNFFDSVTVPMND